MTSLVLDHPALDAALDAAAALLGMEVVFIGQLTPESFAFARVQSSTSWPEVATGDRSDRTDSFCHYMLEGAERTSDAAGHPVFRDVPSRERLGITSYVGVPVYDEAQQVVATLCGIDRSQVGVSDDAVRVLEQLAKVVAAQAGSGQGGDPVIRRSSSGSWRVAGQDSDDLTGAMVLADLLSERAAPMGRPARGAEPLDEVGRLRLSVAQLEYALTARVQVEQAIGVLAERQATEPREAFELLRRAARSRGRAVHALAGDVVASATLDDVELPPELASRG
ncbi:MAG TPA: GAF and ANTAR domain-containing protein [Mycobacteriales bacterium]|nr:GAF and ANTAR domain-containing protein [Mycobacteriales bacterium]